MIDRLGLRRGDRPVALTFIAPTPNIERGLGPKQTQRNLNYEIRNGLVWNIEFLVSIIWICFGFRISSFGFVSLAYFVLCASHLSADPVIHT